MSKSIEIADLEPAGHELFKDSESYLRDVTEEELTLKGGATPLGWTILATYAIAVGGMVLVANSK